MLDSTDWATIASFATAVGTLVLAIATFASIRSANRSARIAEAAFQAQLRPVLVTSRLDDPVQKIRWMDNHWARLEGNQGTAEVVDGNIYLAMSLRNAGSGLAVAVGTFVPLAFGLDAIRQLTSRMAPEDVLMPPALEAAVLAAVAALSIGLAARAMRHMENVAKREGRLTLKWQ